MKQRRVLISEISPYIVGLIQQTIPYMERLNQIGEKLEEAANDDPEFIKLGEELCDIYTDIGAALTEDLAPPVIDEMERRSRIGGQADGCPPREAQPATH